MFRRLAPIVFVVVCVGIALYAWVSWTEALPQYKREALIVPTIFIYVLTLPASMVIQLIYTGLALVLPIDGLDLGSAFLTWLFKTWGPLFIAGYFQWFVLVPRVVRAWRSRDGA